MRMTSGDRTITAELRERTEARDAYDEAIAPGRQASLMEEERPDVFIMRVGAIMPGHRAVVRLQLVGSLTYEDGAAIFRHPLVVAPRYMPAALPGGATDLRGCAGARGISNGSAAAEARTTSARPGPLSSSAASNG